MRADNLMVENDYPIENCQSNIMIIHLIVLKILIPYKCFELLLAYFRRYCFNVTRHEKPLRSQLSQSDRSNIRTSVLTKWGYYSVVGCFLVLSHNVIRAFSYDDRVMSWTAGSIFIFVSNAPIAP